MHLQTLSYILPEKVSSSCFCQINRYKTDLKQSGVLSYQLCDKSSEESLKVIVVALKEFPDKTPHIFQKHNKGYRVNDEKIKYASDLSVLRFKHCQHLPKQEKKLASGIQGLLFSLLCKGVIETPNLLSGIKL